MTLKEIRHALEHALLHEGEMHRELYEYELEEHVDYWKASMRRDRDQFLFVVDVRMNEVTRQPNVALLLLEPSGNIAINEPARDRLKVLWGDAYGPNMQTLIPSFVQQLNEGVLPVHGVQSLQQWRARSTNSRPNRWH
jgi:hypothetical protein